MTRLLVIPLALVGLLAVVFAWSGGGVEKKADFSFINRGDIGTIDPNRMSWMQDIRVGYMLWEGLCQLDPVTLDPIPGAAETIDLNPDKTVYTFHLRKNGKWSDGNGVTTADFVFAWRRMLEEPGDYTYLFFYIKGAQEYSEGFTDNKSVDFSKVGIETPDLLTLRVTLKHPVTFFPDLCAFPPFFPLNQNSMRDFAKRDATTGRVTYDKGFTRPPHLVGNGPYRMVSWEFKKNVRFEANEYYWDRQHVKSRIIDMVSAEDPLASFLKYDSGAVDWQAEVNGDIAAELRRARRPDLHIFPGFGTYFYSVNCRPKLPDGRDNPLADTRVRQALSMAIDKQAIVDNITRMGETPAANYVPPGIFEGYRAPPGLPYDVSRARQLLADAGFPQGRGFPLLSILYNNEFNHGDIAQNVIRQWAEHLGIQLKPEPVEIKTFRERLHNKDYAIARASWFGDYNDPSTFTDKYLSVSDNNDSDWKNQKYDELCAAAAVEPDVQKRLGLLEQAETLVNTELPIIPVYYYVSAYLFRDNVKGIPLNPRNMINFKSVEVMR
jgi:oligopeptide transport system substrate-binding protein